MRKYLSGMAFLALIIQLHIPASASPDDQGYYEEQMAQEYEDQMAQEYEDQMAQEYEDQMAQEYEDQMAQEYEDQMAQEYEDQMAQEYEEQYNAPQNNEPTSASEFDNEADGQQSAQDQAAQSEGSDSEEGANTPLCTEPTQGVTILPDWNLGNTSIKKSEEIIGNQKIRYIHLTETRPPSSTYKTNEIFTEATIICAASFRNVEVHQYYIGKCNEETGEWTWESEGSIETEQSWETNNIVTFDLDTDNQKQTIKRSMDQYSYSENASSGRLYNYSITNELTETYSPNSHEFYHSNREFEIFDLFGYFTDNLAFMDWSDNGTAGSSCEYQEMGAVSPNSCLRADSEDESSQPTIHAGDYSLPEPGSIAKYDSACGIDAIQKIYDDNKK